MASTAKLAWVPARHLRSTSNWLAPPLVTRWKSNNYRSAAVAVGHSRASTVAALTRCGHRKPRRQQRSELVSNTLLQSPSATSVQAPHQVCLHCAEHGTQPVAATRRVPLVTTAVGPRPWRTPGRVRGCPPTTATVVESLARPHGQERGQAPRLRPEEADLSAGRGGYRPRICLQ